MVQLTESAWAVVLILICLLLASSDNDHNNPGAIPVLVW